MFIVMQMHLENSEVASIIYNIYIYIFIFVQMQKPKFQRWHLIKVCSLEYKCRASLQEVHDFIVSQHMQHSCNSVGLFFFTSGRAWLHIQHMYAAHMQLSWSPFKSCDCSWKWYFFLYMYLLDRWSIQEQIHQLSHQKEEGRSRVEEERQVPLHFS